MVAPTYNNVRCADGLVLHVVHVVCVVLRLWLQRRCVMLRPSCAFCTSGSIRAPNSSSVYGASHRQIQLVGLHRRQPHRSPSPRGPRNGPMLTRWWAQKHRCHSHPMWRCCRLRRTVQHSPSPIAGSAVHTNKGVLFQFRAPFSLSLTVTLPLGCVILVVVVASRGPVHSGLALPLGLPVLGIFLLSPPLGRVETLWEPPRRLDTQL